MAREPRLLITRAGQLELLERYAAPVLVVFLEFRDAETNRRLFAVTSNPLARDAIQMLTCQPGDNPL